LRRIEPLGLIAGPGAAAQAAAGLAREVTAGLYATAFRAVAPGQIGPPCPMATLPPDALPPPPPAFAGLTPRAGAGPLVMGIVNVTPDSFSGDGLPARAAIAQAEAQLAAGADILDIGGESTRPGAAPVSPAEEQARILPVIRALAGQAVISVDTRHAATMAAALRAGARIVNDVTALRHDPGALPLVCAAGCPVILMHMPGAAPRAMMALAQYEDVVLEVAAHLAERLATLDLPAGRVALDPGIGFGKTGAHNIALLERLPLLAALGAPLLVGLSRKRFLGTLSGVEPAGERLAPSIAGALFAASRGAAILRVHDVAETVQALAVWRAAASGVMDPAPSLR
jgi:dihydropteroate synthase